METQVDPAVRYRTGEPRLQLADDDVPVMRLLELLRRGARTIALWTVGGAAAGLLLSFVLPYKYTAVTTFSVESQQSGGLGGLGGLAALSGLAGQFGVNLGALGGNAATPDYMVAVINSRTMRDSLLATRFSPEGKVVASGGTPLLDLIPARGRTEAARREHGAKLLAKMVVADVDRKTSLVVVSVVDRNAVRASEIAARTLALVNWYNVSKRRSRSGMQREFAERRLQEAQGELRVAESALESFRSTNRVISTPMLQLEDARLERRVQTKQDLVTVLTQSYEEARLAEAGDLPALSVLDAPHVPVKRSFPRPSVFLPLGLLLGLIGGTIAVLARPAARAWHVLER